MPPYALYESSHCIGRVNPLKLLNPCHMSTYLRVLSESYQMNIVMAGLAGRFGRFESLCTLGLWTKVALALKGISNPLEYDKWTLTVPVECLNATWLCTIGVLAYFHITCKRFSISKAKIPLSPSDILVEPMIYIDNCREDLTVVHLKCISGNTRLTKTTGLLTSLKKVNCIFHFMRW